MNTRLETYYKINEKAWKILAYIVGAIFFIMLCVITWQVICRFILNNSSGWTSEVTMILFVWLIYLGAALAIHDGSQIAMTVVLTKLKAPAKQYFLLLKATICEIMYILLTVSGALCISSFSHVTTPGLGLPMPLVYSCFCVSGVLMCLFGIEEFVKPIIALKKHRRGGEAA